MSAGTDIIGYTYEAAVHCDSCAAERFGRCVCLHNDVHGEDTEGNDVEPIFVSDAGVDGFFCDDCREPLL